MGSGGSGAKHEMDAGDCDDDEEDEDSEADSEEGEDGAFLAYAMLHEVSTVHQMMSEDGQRRVLRRGGLE